jgi:hypothetical protein
MRQLVSGVRGAIGAGEGCVRAAGGLTMNRHWHLPQSALGRKLTKL